MPYDDDIIRLFSHLYDFVITNSKTFNIDESHSISHSMNVCDFAHNIYTSELPGNPLLKQHEKIIYVAAILHDMCDKKYMNELEGLARIKGYLLQHNLLNDTEIDIAIQIISTMSYSKVKACGFPDLKEYQLAYHIVREADLLAAYDFNRCVIFQMISKNMTYTESIVNAIALFDVRVLKHSDDNLFVTTYSKSLSTSLHRYAVSSIWNIRKLIRI